MTSCDCLGNAERRRRDFRELCEAGFISLEDSFFPTVHYPPITMYPPAGEDEIFEGYVNPADNLFVLYVHIPFCAKYCAFCHYPNKIGDLPEEKDRYLGALEKEMDIYMNRLGLRKIQARSILVGGGTSTFLSPGQLERFLAAFTSRVDFSRCTQFNYDVDPLTLIDKDGPRRLQLLRSYGVDRLTIGVQSFDDGILKKMNRHHTAEDAALAVARSQEAGFQVCIEFIYGYPGLTVEKWVKTMEKVVSLGVDEVHNYRLKIIPYGDNVGTIRSLFDREKDIFPSTEETLVMKQAAIDILNLNGYKENLTRVFTRSKNNYSHYASDQCCGLFDQIGFGLTAFSSLRDRFALNTQDFDEYYSLIGRGKLPLNRGLVRSRDDNIRWNIILPLKNRLVYKKYFFSRTGVRAEEVFKNKIERLKKHGLLFEDERIISLTERGRFFADEACHQFFHPSYIPFPKKSYSEAELNPYND